MSNTDPITIWAPDAIVQTTLDRLIDLIRAGAVDCLRTQPAPWLTVPWRDKPWHDGILVDLDERPVAEHIARYIAQHADPSTVEVSGD